MTKYLLFVFTCMSISMYAQKNPVMVTSDGDDFSNLTSQLVVGALTQKEKQDYGQLIGSSENKNLLWGRITFLNATDRDREFILRVSRDFGADRVVAYAIAEGQLLKKYETSGFLSDSAKDVDFQHDLFLRILLPKGKPTLVYLKNYPIQGYSPFFDLQLYNLQDWFTQSNQSLAFQSMFHGVLWVLLVLAFMLFIQTRDRTFLYYSLHLFAFSGFSAIIYNQVGLLIDLPNRPFFFLLFGQSFNMFYLLFLQYFVSLQNLSAWWHHLVRNVVVCLVVVGVAGIAYIVLYKDNLLFIDLVSRTTVAITMIVIICIAILCILKSSSVMKYVGFGTLAMVVGMIISLIHVALFDDQTTPYGQIGVMIEILIFSMGLGYRMRRSELEQRLVQGQLISQLRQNEEMQRTMNAELERMVAESTEEVLYQKREIEVKAQLLETQNASLYKASAFKDRLFAIIGHDLRSPIKSLKGVLDMHTRGQLKQRELELFISKIHKSLNRVISLLDNVLMWALQQMDHIDYQPTRISIRSLVQDNIELLAPLAIEKQIDLVNLVDSELEAFADAEMIKLVIRNIISNAIKFSNRGEAIVVKGSDEVDTILLHVSDKGMGIPKDNIEKLFDDVVYTTYGTASEKGTGLGLSLCNEFVKKNNGFIYVKSELGKGSTFTIELPTKNLRLSA